MVCARCGSAAVSEKQLPSRDFHELRRSELGIDRGSSVGENKSSMSEIRERQGKSDSTWAQFSSWSGLNVWRGIWLVFSWFESLTQSEPADGVTLYCNVNMLNALSFSLTEILSFKNVFETDDCLKRAICTELNWKHYKINLIYQHNVKKQPFCHHSMYTLPCRDSTGVSTLTY